MSGWAHRRVIDSGRSVSVTGAPTLLCSAEVNSLVSASGVLVNADAVDSVSVTWQTAWSSDYSDAADLATLNAAQFAEPLAPGEARHFQFDTRDLRYFRAIGTATGDGAVVRVYGFVNPTLTGASWANGTTGSTVEVDVSATAISGGIQVCSYAGNEGTHDLARVHFGVAQRALRNRALGQQPDTYVIAVDSLGGTQNVACTIEWWEVR